MIAYVLWHWPLAEVATDDYERGELEFHRVLAASEPPGFRGSWTFRVGATPWVPAEMRGYEDWYLLDDFAALGPLNEHAVSGMRHAAHNLVAQANAGAAGAIYTLKGGEARVAEAGYATWITKGRQTSYEDFYTRVEPLAARASGSLWRRAFVLGPATEFCLLSPEPIEAPAGFETLIVERERVGG